MIMNHQTYRNIYSQTSVCKELFNFNALSFTLSALSLLGGGYRSRTDDPLLARQVLWPAELIPLSTLNA